MAKIGYKIEDSNSSAVLYKIGSILADEFAHQLSLGNSFLPTIVDIDTIDEVEQNGLPYCAINWFSAKYKDSNITYENYDNSFIIDVKSSGYSSVRKTLSVIRTILMYNEYSRLDLAGGLMTILNIKEMGINIESERRESRGVINGYLLVTCNIQEANAQPNFSTSLDKSASVFSANEIGSSFKILTYNT